MTYAFKRIRKGDVVKIHPTNQPYRLEVNSKINGPITIESATRNKPTITSSGGKIILHLIDVSNWTIRNIRFDGTNQEVKHAIKIVTKKKDSSNIQISNNEFHNIGGFSGNLKKASAIRLSSSKKNKYVTNSVISGNTFTSNAHSSIILARTKNITINNNVLLRGRCGKFNDTRVGEAS